MPKRITITASDELAEAIEILRRRRHYRTISEYFVALARYDGQTQREHHLTNEWAALTGYERDRLDAGILRLVQGGKGIRGSWIEACIDESIKRHLDAGHTPTAKEVAADVAQKIAEAS